MKRADEPAEVRGGLANVLTASLVVLLTLALALPAAAAAPEKSDVFFALEGADCGGGLTYDIELVGQEIIHDMGDLVRVNVIFGGEAVASDGTVIRVRHSWTETLDFAEGTLTVVGLSYGTWVAGGTAKKLDHGRVVIDLATFEIVFQAGSWTVPFDPHVLTCELIQSA